MRIVFVLSYEVNSCIQPSKAKGNKNPVTVRPIIHLLFFVLIYAIRLSFNFLGKIVKHDSKKDEF